MTYHKLVERQVEPAFTRDDQGLKNEIVATVSREDVEAAIAAAHKLRAEQARVVALAVVGGVKKLVNAVLGYFRMRKAAAQLRGMSDRQLADIGLSRAEIAAAVHYGRSADSRYAKVDTLAIGGTGKPVFDMKHAA
jgi:uncharacterized protein YjiS (DUF1127 family)